MARGTTRAVSDTFSSEVSPSAVATPDYLTPQQVAEKLQLSVKSVYRLAGRDGDVTLPVTKVGGSIRFHRGRLEKWLVSRTQGPGRSMKVVRKSTEARKVKPGAVVT
jgi:excisionase family DNA binding protein